MTTAELHRTRPDVRVRPAAVVVWASWPVGLLLIVAHTIAGVLDLLGFVLLATGYAAALVAAVRNLSRDTGVRQPAPLLVLAGPMIFVLAGLTRPPTAAEPGLMLLNAAVLAAAAVVLLVAATHYVLGQDRLDRAAVLGLLGIYIGSAGWLVNLVARWAVVLSGASGLQLEVEDSAWMANVYLRGLPEEPSFLAYLLVLMDLLQVVYLALCYLGFALIGRAMVRDRLAAARPGRIIVAISFALAGITLVSAAAAAWVGPVGAVAAGAAFGLSIPFMSTLMPYLLGSAVLTRTDRPR